jgi:hypothetical protein
MFDRFYLTVIWASRLRVDVSTRQGQLLSHSTLRSGLNVCSRVDISTRLKLKTKTGELSKTKTGSEFPGAIYRHRSVKVPTASDHLTVFCFAALIASILFFSKLGGNEIWRAKNSYADKCSIFEICFYR